MDNFKLIYKILKHLESSMDNDSMATFNNDPDELIWVKKNADEYLEKRNKLDKAIRGFKAEESFVTYRGTTSSNSYYTNINVGDNIVLDKGFLSTSLNRDVIKDFQRGINRYEFEITVPKGYDKGSFISELSDIPEEKEFLFIREASFKIIEIEKLEDITVVKLEAI